MKFRYRTKSEIGLFGVSTDHPDWVMPANGDSQTEVMIQGAERAEKKWSSLDAPIAPARWRVGVLLAIVVFGLLLGRSAYLQVLAGEYFRLVAEANRTRVNVLPSHRGIITDRNGTVLAENTPAFRLLAWPQDVDLATVEPLVELLHLSGQDLRSKLSTTDDDDQILLAEDIKYDQALSFYAQSEKYPGFSIEFSEKRKYYTGAIPTLSHVLGYTGPVTDDEYQQLRAHGYRRFDNLGKLGLEAWYEEKLRGQYGDEVTEVNAQGHALRIISRREPVDGQDLVLSLDARLQAYIEVALERGLATTPTKRAVVVVMNPNTGEVLALVSTPSYDANLFANGISSEAYNQLLNDPSRPLFPRGHAGEYPAGSVIKPVFAAAALANGTITPSTTFLSTGGLMLGNRFFPDWRPGGHGVTNVYHAIADSVNTFFYMIGGGNETFPGMGLEKLMTAALSFGYGQRTGIDLPGEANGFLPSKTWKEETKGEPWYIGDTYNVSIGQGDFLATPLQVARATAVFANGGNLVTPHFVTGVDQLEQKILETDVLEVVRDGMRQTVTNGSARSLQAVSVPVAGKTGTAQWSSVKPAHSWFTGFAPFDNPEIVITVLVEQGGDETAAVPITKDILEWYFANRD